MGNALREIVSGKKESFKIIKKYRKKVKNILEKEIAIECKQRRFGIPLQEPLGKNQHKGKQQIVNIVNQETLPENLKINKIKRFNILY